MIRLLLNVLALGYNPIARYAPSATNLRESRQRVDVVRVDFDQVIHEEEQQR